MSRKTKQVEEVETPITEADLFKYQGSVFLLNNLIPDSAQIDIEPEDGSVRMKDVYRFAPGTDHEVRVTFEVL